MKWLLSKSVPIGFGLALILFVDMHVISYETTHKLFYAHQRVNHSYQMLQLLDRLLFQMQAVEAAQSNYILTGKETALASYQAATKSVPPTITALRALAGDHYIQQRNMDALEPLIALKLAELSDVVALRKSRGLEVAAQLVRSEKGKDLTQELRTVMDHMQNEENGRLVHTSPLLEAYNRNTTHIIVVGSLLALILIGMAVYIIRRDIRQRVQAEEALQKSKQQYQALFEANPHPTGVYDTATLRFLAVNDAAVDLYGYSHDEFRAMTVTDLFPPEDGPIFLDYMEKAPLRTACSGIWQHRKKDGAAMDIDLVNHHLVFEDRPARLIIARDITERKRVEQALREREEQFRLAFESGPIGMAIVALDYRFVKVNRSLCDMLGYKEIELLSRTFFDVTHPADINKDIHLATQVFKGERTSYSIEKRYITKNQSTVWVHFTATVMRGADGKPLYGLGMIENITERKLADDALKQANDALKHSVGELEQRTREITLLTEMSDLYQACLTMNEAYKITAQMVQNFFPSESGALYVLNDTQNLLEHVAAWGQVPMKEGMFAPDDCWALRRGRLHAVAAPTYGPLCRHLNRPAVPEAHFCIPMMAQGKILGVLCLQGSENAPARRLESNQRLAVTVAEQVALALSNLKLQDTLRSQATRDPLTGLFNRRYMEESLTREVQRAARNRRPVGIIMLDLDHFKQFNDTFGHAAGDSLLRELGAFLKTHIREEDIASRYGGEEFTLILPEAPLDVTRDRAEHLREEFNRFQTGHLHQPLTLVTVSLGVAAFPDCGATGDAVLRSADAALYRAKQSGRDRLVVAQAVKSCSAHEG